MTTRFRLSMLLYGVVNAVLFGAGAIAVLALTPSDEWKYLLPAVIVASLAAALPIAWLIGADSLRQLHTWHRWRDLFGLAHVLVVERPGAGIAPDALRQAAPEVAGELAWRQCAPEGLVDTPSGGIALLPLPGLRPESSTELRRRIRAGEPWEAWVPPAVAAYIVRQGLYRDPPVILPPSPQSPRP